MLQPLTGKRSRGGGQVLYREIGSTHWNLMGDVGSFNVNVTVEKEDIYSNEYPTRTLVETSVTEVSADVSFECRMLTDWVRAASVMGSIQYDTQSAQTAATFTASDVKAGQIFDLGYLDVTVTSVTDGNATTPVPYTEGTHYTIDGKSGMLQINAVPSGADTTVDVTFDVAAITATDARLLSGVAQDTTLKVELMYIGHNEKGVRERIKLHNVEISPSGDRPFQSAEQDIAISITGKAVPDDAQPSGYKIGTLQTLA